MVRGALICAVVTFALAGVANAECSPAEEEKAGKLTISVLRAQLDDLPAAEGKQLINLKSCDVRGGRFTVDFRYNFTGAGGFYWVEGDARFDESGAGDVSPKRVSDNLKDGVQLAAR